MQKKIFLQLFLLLSIFIILIFFFKTYFTSKNIKNDLTVNENLNSLKNDDTKNIIHNLRYFVTSLNNNEYIITSKFGELSHKQPNIINMKNVKGTINLLEFAKHHNIKQFVFASSSSVYGTNPNVPWVEDSQIDHIISPYAGTKRSAEIQGKIYSHLYGIRFIALRLFTVFGPKQRPDLAIHKFSELILNDKPITLYGKGDTIRDYTYVDDIVGAFISAISYDQSLFEIINIGRSVILVLHLTSTLHFE